jgi:hypothetical protein
LGSSSRAVFVVNREVTGGDSGEALGHRTDRTSKAGPSTNAECQAAFGIRSFWS